MVIVNRRKSIWSNWLVQLGGCILLAAVLPTLYRYYTIDIDVRNTLGFTFVGIVAAILFGFWLLRNMTTYPGVEKGSYIFPSIGTAYFLLLMTFVLGRFEYNRGTLLFSFAVALIWLFLVQYQEQRTAMLRIGYIDFSEKLIPIQMRSVVWKRLMNSDITSWGDVDIVATDLRVDVPEDWDRALASAALAGMPVFHLKHLIESLTGQVELEHLSENSFGSLIPLSAYKRVKLTLDWIVALIALVILSPLLILIALTIRATSPGPAIFKQVRVGYRGELFTVWKFRSMRIVEDADIDRSVAMTRHNDDRVTKIGRFLRKTRIDELPQIINVLRGEMSWIGPRPEAEVLSRWYEQEIPFYRYRHIVRPGITGWAQVCQGHVSEVEEVRSKLHYDFYYIKNFSPWFDLLIVARTIYTMVTGFGAR